VGQSNVCSKAGNVPWQGTLDRTRPGKGRPVRGALLALPSGSGPLLQATVPAQRRSLPRARSELDSVAAKTVAECPQAARNPDHFSNHQAATALTPVNCQTWDRDRRVRPAALRAIPITGEARDVSGARRRCGDTDSRGLVRSAARHRPIGRRGAVLCSAWRGYQVPGVAPS
jgi:hypothetical protein